MERFDVLMIKGNDHSKPYVILIALVGDKFVSQA